MGRRCVPRIGIRGEPIRFVATALEDLREFPLAVRRECGYQLDRVQRGLEPADWKTMPGVGLGVREIRMCPVEPQPESRRCVLRSGIRGYVAKLAEHVYVLHCFQKKSQKTSAVDLSLVAKRLAQVVEQVKEGER